MFLPGLEGVAKTDPVVTDERLCFGPQKEIAFFSTRDTRRHFFFSLLNTSAGQIMFL